MVLFLPPLLFGSAFHDGLGRLPGGAAAELIRLHRDHRIHVSVPRTLESELDLEELRLKRLIGAVAG